LFKIIFLEDQKNKIENETFETKYTPVQQVFYQQIQTPEKKEEKKGFFGFFGNLLSSLFKFLKDLLVKNFGWIILLSLIFGISKGVKENNVSGYSEEEFIFSYEMPKKDDSKSEIAVININTGIDTFSTSSYIGIDEIKKLMLDANKNEKVKAIVLMMNSPGGSVVGSKNLYDFVKKFDQTKKPVYTYVQDMSASGSYMTALATRKIYADPNSLVGNVGVIMEIQNFSKALDKVGIQFLTIKSGEYKDVGYYGDELTQSELDFFQQLVDEAFLDFKNLVIENRKDKITDLEDVFTGKIYSGKQAKNIGLVDEIGSLEDLVKEICELQNIDQEKTRVYYYNQSLGFLDSILASQSQSFKIFGFTIANFSSSDKNISKTKVMYEWKV